MTTTTLLSKVQTAIQLLAEVQQALANQPSEASEPPSEEATKPLSEELPTTSEELRTTSEELRTPTENTESKPRQRSEKQVAAFKANFQKRWSNKTTSKASIYDDIC